MSEKPNRSARLDRGKWLWIVLGVGVLVVAGGMAGLLRMRMKESERQERIAQVLERYVVPRLNDKDFRIQMGAAKTLGRLASEGEKYATEVLAAEIGKGNLVAVCGARDSLIRMARPGTEELLIRALNDDRLGRYMEWDLLHCGNPKLARAVREWAGRKGRDVSVRGPSLNRPTPRWGVPADESYPQPEPFR